MSAFTVSERSEREVDEHVSLWSFCNDVSKSLSTERRLFSLCSHLFFFCRVKAFCQTSSSLKKLPPHFLVFFTAHRSGVLLCNHISRSFVTALSQHAMCLTPEKNIFSVSARCQEESSSRHFAKIKTRRIQNRIHFCNCECNHRRGFVCMQSNVSAHPRVNKW